METIVFISRLCMLLYVHIIFDLIQKGEKTEAVLWLIIINTLRVNQLLFSRDWIHKEFVRTLNS